MRFVIASTHLTYSFSHQSLIFPRAIIKQGTFTPIEHDQQCRNGATRPV